MLDFIQYYDNPFEKELNRGLMNKSYDEDLILYLAEAMESLEVLPNIHFDGYSFTDYEHLIDENSFVRLRKSSKKNKKITTMPISESRCGEFKAYFTLTCGNEVAKISKKMLVPLQDEHGYFQLKGMRYLLLYQLLEASTYVSRDKVALKSLQPVTIKRSPIKINDINGDEYTCPVFEHFIFKKPMVALLFYLAQFGFEGALGYFNTRNIIDVVHIGDEDFDEEEYRNHNVIHFDKWDDSLQDPKYLYFQRSKKLMFRVHKKMFDKYPHVKAMIGMLKSITSNRLTLEDIYDKEYWLLKLDEANSSNKKNSKRTSGPSIDKGKNTLLHFSRMMDKTTTRNLKISMLHKKDAFAVVRWLILEYDNLYKKDNMDLGNKRLRCNEYFGSMLTEHLSNKLSRAFNKGKKCKMDDVKQIFKFSGDIILKSLYGSGILPFDDRTSDLDFFNKFKYTSKGPNSLGNKNENSISIRYRGIHPSFIGKIDLNVCGNSDPGRSGLLTPFCKTNKLFFNDEYEPQSVYDEYIEDLYNTVIDKESAIVVSANSEEERVEAYNKIMDSSSRFYLLSTEPEDIKDEDYTEVL